MFTNDSIISDKKLRERTGGRRKEMNPLKKDCNRRLLSALEKGGLIERKTNKGGGGKMILKICGFALN